MKLKKISTFIVLFLLCLIPSKVFAYDGVDVTNDNAPDNLNDTVTYFEKVATKEDEDYVRLRNSLINLYGIDKAYTLLGSTKNIVSSYAVPGETTSREVSKFIPSKGTMKTIIYKNPVSNNMDVWYEMNYTVDTSGTGAKTFGDGLAGAFNNSTVYNVATSYSATISDFTPASTGGSGTIKGGSIYGRMVFTLKPRSGNISDCRVATNMTYCERENNLIGGITFNIQAGVISASIAFPATMTRHTQPLTY